MKPTEEEKSKIRKLADKVEGWLTYKEGETLYDLAKKCTGKGVIVEIGSWKGKSTIWLAKGSKRGNRPRIYAIDPHKSTSVHEKYDKDWTFNEFKENIIKLNVNDIITPIVKTSEKAVKNFNKPIELIFIDGSHEYDQVKSDFRLWVPKVIDGGIMAFHDTIFWPGPKKVVEEFVYKSRNFRNTKFVDSITFAEKVAQNSFQDRVRNIYVLSLKNLYEFVRSLSFLEPFIPVARRIIRIIH